MFRCPDPLHEGERCLPIEQKGHGRKCKACRAADARRYTAEKAKARQEALRARFESADAWETFNQREFVRKAGKHRYVVPKAEEFGTVEAFEEALRRHHVREKEGGDGRASEREYRDASNAKRREAYVRKTPLVPPPPPPASEQCTNCKKFYPRESFRPSEVEKETKKRDAFDAALSEIEAAEATRETHPKLFARWDNCRTSRCKLCKEKYRKLVANANSAVGQCRELWYELRKAPCVDCGRDDGYSEYDHQLERGDKVHNVSDYGWWKYNGGVEAMQAEAAKCVPRCRNCHSMQPSHNIFKRKYASVDDMPSGTMDELRAKFGRRYMDDKLAFVNARKMQIGACDECRLNVMPESCHVFAFAHLDASLKKKSVAKLCNSRASLPSTQAALEEEMGKCRLLCSVCHSIETRARNTV